MDYEALVMAIGASGNGGGGGSLIPVPTAQDIGKFIEVVSDGGSGAEYGLISLVSPMVFKGSLGTGGTISTLPTASSENEGFVYIVITDGTYAGQAAKAGDTFVSDGSSWVLVPSGDEPSVIDDSVTSTALTWSSDKLYKDLKIKTLTYTGNGSGSNKITFPEIPSVILGIFGNEPTEWRNTWLNNPCMWGVSTQCHVITATSAGASNGYSRINYDADAKYMQIIGANANYALNAADVEFTVFYI